MTLLLEARRIFGDDLTEESAARLRAAVDGPDGPVAEAGPRLSVNKQVDLVAEAYRVFADDLEYGGPA